MLLVKLISQVAASKRRKVPQFLKLIERKFLLVVFSREERRDCANDRNDGNNLPEVSPIVDSVE